MAASIAWYGTAADSSDSVSVGPVKLSLAGVYVGIMSSAMTLPINILIVLLFRYSRPKETDKVIPKTNPTAKKTDADPEKGDKDTVDEGFFRDDDEPEYYVEEELKDQREFLDHGDPDVGNLRTSNEITEEDAGLTLVANIPLPKDLAVGLLQ